MKSENDIFDYPPRAHLIKGNVPDQTIAYFGWKLYNTNRQKKDGKYDLIQISTKDIPDNIVFFGDPRYQNGYITKETIPPYGMKLIGVIDYTDKNNYRGEPIIRI